MPNEKISDLSKQMIHTLRFLTILQFILSILIWIFSNMQTAIYDEVKTPYYSLVFNNLLLVFTFLLLPMTVIFLNFCYVFYVFYVFKHCINEKNLTRNFVIALIILTVMTIYEKLLYLHTTCFKNNDETYIILRSLFAIMVMSISIGMNNLLYSKHKFSCKSKCVVTTISFINILSIASILLNIFLLVNIKEYSSVKNSSKDIKLAFFNNTEIAKIESGVYVKDEFYKYRVIATVEQVLYSNYKKLAYSEKTSRDNTNHYYYVAFIFDLFCNSENSIFYKDCQNSTQLKMIVQYINDGGFPRYNCAYNQSNKIVLDCPNLRNSYSLVLIQELQDTVSLAWKSIAKCNQVPTFYIERNSILDPWRPFSKSNQITTNKLFYFYILFLFILFFQI